MSLIHKTIRVIKIDGGMNKIVSLLIMSDFFVWGGWGLIGPIFPVFMTRQIEGANLEAVGLASTVFLLLKSGLQIPIAHIVDNIKGEKDDHMVMVIGSTIIAAVPILYIFIRNVPQLLLAQAFYGVGCALAYPTWLAFFTRHVDKGQENKEWSIYQTTVGLSGAAVAGLGGFLAERIGFRSLFIIVSVFSAIGSFCLIKVGKKLR